MFFFNYFLIDYIRERFFFIGVVYLEVFYVNAKKK